MNRARNRLSRWLEAEHAGRVEAAERALTELLGVLVVPAPAPDFKQRVMGRLDLAPSVVKIGLGWRLTLAACLTLLALWTALLPLAVSPLFDAARAGQLVQLVGAFLVTGSQALAAWLAFWHSLAEANRVLMTIISKPPIAATLVTVAGLTALSFRVMSDLVASERSTDHV